MKLGIEEIQQDSQGQKESKLEEDGQPAADDDSLGFFFSSGSYEPLGY